MGKERYRLQDGEWSRFERLLQKAPHSPLQIWPGLGSLTCEYAAFPHHHPDPPLRLTPGFDGPVQLLTTLLGLLWKLWEQMRWHPGQNGATWVSFYA